MTAEQFGRAIAVYPALLAAYAGAPVVLEPDDALALLDLFDALGDLARLEGQRDMLEHLIRRRLTHPKPTATPSKPAAWERAMRRSVA